MTRSTPRLDAVKAERDALLLRCVMAEREREEACTLLLAAQRELVPTVDALEQAREDLRSTRYQLNEARAVLTAARKVNAFYAGQDAQLKQRLAAVRAVLVARDGGHLCLRCDAEIERGQAYEPMPSTVSDQYVLSDTVTGGAE